MKLQTWLRKAFQNDRPPVFLKEQISTFPIKWEGGTLDLAIAYNGDQHEEAKEWCAWVKGILVRMPRTSEDVKDSLDISQEDRSLTITLGGHSDCLTYSIGMNNRKRKKQGVPPSLGEYDLAG